MGFLNTKLNKKCQSLVYQDIENVIIQSIKYMSLVKTNVNFIENEITDIWISTTLMNDSYRKQNNVLLYRFDRETQENYLPAKTGHVDVKVTISPISFENVSAYYIIECKRIDGKLKLNKEYYINGIKRFVSKSNNYYTFYNNKAMMVMYIKNDNIDIQKCIKSINCLQSSDRDVCVVNDLQIVDNEQIISKYWLNNKIIEMKHFIFKVENLIIKED